MVNRLLNLDGVQSATDVRVVQGTIQKINYARKELSIISDGQIWHLAVDPGCVLEFDDQTAILRCFHPLDQVRIEFIEKEPRHRLVSMRGWERVAQAV